MTKILSGAGNHSVSNARIPALLHGSLPFMKEEHGQGGPRTLNSVTRLATERSINKQNEQMLNRLQGQRSHYNVA